MAGAPPLPAVSRAFAEALSAKQRALGAGPRAEANALALASGALVVATGQQPGLFGGPLLAAHKAMGAVALAHAEAARLGRPVVPVFWVASEDHDAVEVDRAVVMDVAGAPRAISLGLVPDGRSVRDLPLEPAAVERALAGLAAALPPTERTRAALALARPPAGTDLGAWFARVLCGCLGDTGLVFVEPVDVEGVAGATYARLVEDAERIQEAVRAAGAARRSRGEAAPLDPAPGTAPLFLREGARGPRRRVSFDGDAVLLRGAPSSWTRTTLAAHVAAHPDLASGDVVGRVFVQGGAFPVTSIVAGATEAAYLAQIAEAHRAVGLAAPTIVVRPSATWVEAKVEEALVAAGTSVGDAAAGRARAPEVAVDEADPLERRALALLDAARALDLEAEAAPGLRGAARAAVQGLEKALRGHRDEREARAGRGRARFDRALAAVRPLGEPQERVLSPLSIVARHGVEGFRAGLATLGGPGTHCIVRLGGPSTPSPT